MSKIPAQISSVFPSLLAQESQSLPAINLEAFCLSLPRCLDHWRWCSTLDISFVFQLLGNVKMDPALWDCCILVALFLGWLGDQLYWRRYPFPYICSAAIFFRGLAASKHPALAPNDKDKEKPKVWGDGIVEGEALVPCLKPPRSRLFLKDFVSRNHMNRMKLKNAILDEIIGKR